MKSHRFGAVLIIIGLMLGMSVAIGQPDSLWSRTYGGEGNDTLWALIRSVEGGLAMTGYLTPEDTAAGQICLIKTTANGNLSWMQTYGELAHEEGRDIKQTPDRGFVIVGYTHSDPQDHQRRGLVYRTDSEGEEAWVRYLGETEYSDAYSVVINEDRSFTVGGVFYPGGDWHDDLAFWKMDFSGNMQWMQHYGEREPSEYGLSLTSDPNGGYAIAGQRILFGEQGVEDGAAILFRVDANGSQ
ncbi:MAG: hypothetical protein V2A61_06765, partial [Calditrichota bacterium]